METAETVEDLETLETVQTGVLKKYSVTDNLKTRDASASKNL